ncbi:MAG: cobT [Nocardioidaceae bacterium]|nr:cobT [Nocardioidaceae bacterium]
MKALDDPLRFHGDTEAVGMIDFAVNVFPGPPPTWLSEAMHAGLDDAGHYPDPSVAEKAIAKRHGRPATEVLATAGAAEAFGLLARLSPWSMPVVVHPQFTEPQAALEEAQYDVVEVPTDAEFRLDPAAVPEEADLVFVGNPTNPTGVLHPKESILALLRPGRLVVVDEAFMDVVAGESESLAEHRDDGLVVLRSLTKHWGIPGVRAGYLLAHAAVVRDCRLGQTPWSVSSTALAALVACSSPDADADADARAATLTSWREHLEQGLDSLGIRRVPSAAGFVLAKVGEGVHDRLRTVGVAVRRADTFPGLGPAWVRIAARPPDLTDQLLHNLR